ncbi:hypothetical protein [Streptomyces sp. NPDC057545]|uniref:hypothetical protein n=1 Tax=Streptomyces sp. NPDC057545 TaxID=3346164 RepID=UPI0036AF554D
MTEALSRLLGRPVTCREAGWPPGPDSEQDVTDMGRADMDPSRRKVLKGGMYAAALVVPRVVRLVADGVQVAHLGVHRVAPVRASTCKRGLQIRPTSSTGRSRSTPARRMTS